MSALYEDRPRQVVPRWRLFDETLRRGELSPISTPEKPRFTEEMVVGQVHDWKKFPTLSVASDLVSVALTLGLDKIAVDAAQFVHAQLNAPPSARSVAAIYLRNAGFDLALDPEQGIPEERVPITGRSLPAADRQYIVQIHNIRVILSAYPRNPISWCNLSLLYTSLGVLEKADRAMRVALWLAPENRFVLRAASRFFLHQGEKDRAHRLLAQSRRLIVDPWILSAEVAIADSMHKSSLFIKTARRALDSGRHSSLHTSELASAIGTIELKAGKVKSGRRIISLSLRNPSENSVAQAAWLARNVVSLDVSAQELHSSPEASTWAAWREGRWDKTLEEAWLWLIDQPFSSRPAIHGSYVASTVYEDYLQAEMYADLGLRSNPDDVTLLNNLIFAKAMSGDIEGASKKLRSIDAGSLDASESIAYLATKGLVAFRSGLPETGRSLYDEAIRMARVKHDDGRRIIARIYLALEESRIGSDNAGGLRQEAIRLASSGLISPLGNAFAGQLKRYDTGLSRNKT